MSYPEIPEQKSGSYHDTVSMYCANSLSMAELCYKALEERLKLINDWHTYSEDIKTHFTLYNETGNTVINSPQPGNLVRIDIPGINNPSGDGYDWVKVIDIQFESGNEPFYSITMKPCPAPNSQEEITAHFYTQGASSTFIVRRLATCIYAEVHGRNEEENTSDVPLLDKARNKAIAIGGKLGLGKMNWMALTNGLLEPFKTEKKL